MKNNINYKRFRHFYKDKVNMDFAFFAIAFNINRMCAKSLKNGIKLEFAVFAIKNETNQAIY